MSDAFMKMQFLPVKTRILNPPQDDIFDVLENMPSLNEGDVVFITSKILAIHQGRCIAMDDIENKDALIFQEADSYIPRPGTQQHHVVLTIKDHTLIPSAGIDESNSNQHYVLWPENVRELLKEIHLFLCKKNNIENLGLVSTDSHTLPLRSGVVGISTGVYGFNPLRDYRGEKDLFDRKLQMSQSNIADALSAMAVLLMGEGNEGVPVVILRGYENIMFSTKDYSENFYIKRNEDLYDPILERFQND